MRTLLVVLSEGCNLDCSYCGVDKRSAATIDPDLYLEEFHKLRTSAPSEIIKIDFFGGEPLMQLPLIRQIIDGVSEDGNVKLFMPTNGLLLTQDVVDYLISKNVEISLSFDGLWQDKNRLQLTGRGTLHKILSKRELFRTIPGLRVHSMITRGCYNLLENHLFIKDQIGVNAELTLVRDVGVWTDASISNLIVGIRELFDWYINDPSNEMPMFIKFYLRRFINYHLSKVATDNCGAGTDVHMFVNNQILPCTRFKDRPDLLDQIAEYETMVECERCSVKNYCDKGCLFEQIKNQGPIRQLCTVYRYIYTEVSQMTNALNNNQRFLQTMNEEVTRCQLL